MFKIISILISVIAIPIVFARWVNKEKEIKKESCLIESISFLNDYEVRFFYDENGQIDSATTKYDQFENAYTVKYAENGLVKRINEYNAKSNKLTHYTLFIYNNQSQLERIDHFNHNNELEYYEHLVYQQGKLKYNYLNGNPDAVKKYYWEGKNVIKEEVRMYNEWKVYHHTYDQANNALQSFAAKYIWNQGGEFLEGSVLSKNNLMKQNQNINSYNSDNYPHRLDIPTNDIHPQHTISFAYANCK